MTLSNQDTVGVRKIHDNIAMITDERMTLQNLVVRYQNKKSTKSLLLPDRGAA